MEKCMIYYVSTHHGNTEKVVRSLSAQNPEIEVCNLITNAPVSLPDDVLCGFASGVYYGKPHPAMLKAIKALSKSLKGRRVFTLMTDGFSLHAYLNTFCECLTEQGAEVLGGWQCRGFDTYGFWKKLGGISKKHPNDQDLKKANAFYHGLKVLADEAATS